MITLTNRAGQTIRWLTLTRNQAEQTSKQTLGGGIAWSFPKRSSSRRRRLWLYGRRAGDRSAGSPPLAAPLTSADERSRAAPADLFTRYQVKRQPKVAPTEHRTRRPDRAVVELPPDVLDGIDNVYLSVDYQGDVGSCFIDGKLVADNFYNGTNGNWG